MRGRFLPLLLLVLLLLTALPASAATVRDIEVPDDAVTCDLSALKRVYDNQTDKIIAGLNAIPTLTACDMTQVTLSAKAALALTQGCPQIRFHFSLPLAQKAKVDSETEILDVDSYHVAKSLKYDDLARVLQCMPNLKKVTMYDCNYSVTKMEELMALLPDVEFEWTLRFNKLKLKNTATAYSTLKGRQDPRYTAEDLQPIVDHVPGLLALDVGHNNVSDISFVRAWPNLRRLIVIDSKTPVTDISVLAELPDLEYVELFMQDITDISALANHTKLLDLNLCHNNITDLTPLYSCVNLERLWISYNPNLTEEELDAFRAALPNCTVVTDVWSSTGEGWREHPRYEIMYESFKTGVYIPFDETTENEAVTE